MAGFSNLVVDTDWIMEAKQCWARIVLFLKQYPVFICRANFHLWWPLSLISVFSGFLFTICMLLLPMSLPESTWLGRLYPLLSSRLLWLRRYPPRGRDEHVVFLVLCWPVRCCSVLCGFLRRVDGAKHQSMTSVGEVTAEEGREKFLCTQPGIKPATSRLWDEDGTTRPLQVHRIVHG
jgi:hypothetical protein